MLDDWYIFWVIFNPQNADFLIQNGTFVNINTSIDVYRYRTVVLFHDDT